jgi:Na+/H+ antiporter NhaA
MLHRRYVMKLNMGIVDRIIRGVLAVVVGALYFTHQLSPVAAIVLGIVAVIFLVTAVVGVCPLYLAVGLSTKRHAAA